jgi:4'-phosphopantetheinyl transferase EntD
MTIEFALPLPDGFVVEHVFIDGDRHAAGQLAARRALARLGCGTLAYDGARPIVANARAAVSITHGRRCALAVAAHVSRIGIDLVDDADSDRLARIAERYLHAEHVLAATPRARAECFAAKEAGLKALGLGLLDGGMFDVCAVRVVSLDPPALSAGLALVLGRTADGTIAVAHA